MKKLIMLVLTLMVAFLLFGCVQQQQTQPPITTPEEPEQPITTPEEPEQPIMTENMLECTYNLNGITKVQTQYGTMVRVYWQVPISIKNNSDTDAKNVAITFTPIGQEEWKKTYVLDTIAAGETVDEVFNYSVRGVTWVNPKVTVTAENVEVSDSCQLAEIQKPA